MKTQPLRVTLREATGNAIVDAAEKVAARDGVSSASLQAIADQAGVAVGTIYNYFKDKDALFDALFARRREELFAAMDTATKLHRSDPFVEQLNAFLRTVFGYYDAHRDFLRISLEVVHVRVIKGEAMKRGPVTQQLLERAERIVRIGAREKQLRDDGTSFLAAFLVSIVRGVLVALAETEQPFLPEVERVAHLFLHGAAK
jgi:AcrR family transcriptional regulator